MVSIDNVYQTVLNILNKENRGYITPTEFNTLAKQAQTEIFEMYFTTQYRVSQGPMSDGDYSDIDRNIEEKITFFDNVMTIQTDQGTEDTIDTTMAVDPRPGFYAYPSNFYRLGIVSVNGVHADEVSHKDLLYINRSPLTAPVATQPVYTRHEGGIVLYPLNSFTRNMTTDDPPVFDGTYTISGDVQEIEMVYVREPATPRWVGGSMMGQVIPDTANADYQNFELHPSEEPELVAKILAYSGLIIRAADVLQAAAGKEQAINQDNG